MCAIFSLAFYTSILIVAALAAQLPTPPRAFDQQAKKGDSPAPLKSERTPKIIEYIYMDKIRKSRITRKSEQAERENPEMSDDGERSDYGESVQSVKNVDNEENEEEMDTYICRRMAKLQRVPMCVRLFDRPHYRDELKIKFNFLAYRGAKPECAKQKLAFRTKSMNVHAGVKQEMLLCPGRHHPLRTSWQLDDYREVFYVSSGAVPATPPVQAAAETSVQAAGETSARPVSTRRPIPDSVVVYKREWTADRERFFVYDIIYDFKPRASSFAIVTEYDIEEELFSMNAISYNNNAAEVERIYIREMFKPLDLQLLTLSFGQDTQLSRHDKIAHLSDSELVTLCWVILDQPQYKEIGFEPRPPPKHMNENAIVAEPRTLHFQHSVHYNREAVQQPMHGCKSRYKPISRPRNAKPVPERIQISSGARPNSYFVYTLHKGKEWGKYNIFEFVENLPIERGTSAEKSAEIPPADWQVTEGTPLERDTASFEMKFIRVVHKRNAKE